MEERSGDAELLQICEKKFEYPFFCIPFGGRAAVSARAGGPFPAGGSVRAPPVQVFVRQPHHLRAVAPVEPPDDEVPPRHVLEVVDEQGVD